MAKSPVRKPRSTTARSTKSRSAPARRSTTRQRDPLAVVELFFERARHMDMESAAELLAEDCVYQNVPYHEAIGKDRIQRDLARMSKPVSGFEVEMINVAVNGNTVLTERMDIFIGKGFRSELPVMGIFVVEDGKITEWRDYFDWTFAFGRAAGAVIDALRTRIGISGD